MGDMSAVALVSNPIRRRRRISSCPTTRNILGGADLIWQHVAHILDMVITKGDGHMESRKYRGEEQACPASGPDSRRPRFTRQSSDWKKTNCLLKTAASEKAACFFQVYAMIRLRLAVRCGIEYSQF